MFSAFTDEWRDGKRLDKQVTEYSGNDNLIRETHAMPADLQFSPTRGASFA